MEKKQRIASDYDKTSSSYNKRYSQIQFEKFKLLSGLDIRGIILDLGCGSGLLANYLKRKDLFGCDISLEMCKLASKKEIVVCCDIDYLPYKSSCIDAVLSFTALQNLESFEKVFKEVHRVLKPSGLFVCSVLNKVDVNELIREAELAGFKIKKKSVCGEDICFVASSNL